MPLTGLKLLSATVYLSFAPTGNCKIMMEDYRGVLRKIYLSEVLKIDSQYCIIRDLKTVSRNCVMCTSHRERSA